MAVNFLENQGYEILERNYRYRRNEIDLIALHENTLIFIEVKTRSGIGFGLPEEAVDEHQQARILAAAEQYLFDINWTKNIRFDIVAILINQPEPEISHFIDAFG